MRPVFLSLLIASAIVALSQKAKHEPTVVTPSQAQAVVVVIGAGMISFFGLIFGAGMIGSSSRSTRLFGVAYLVCALAMPAGLLIKEKMRVARLTHPAVTVPK